jgi:hypothetical protein
MFKNFLIGVVCGVCSYASENEAFETIKKLIDEGENPKDYLATEKQNLINYVKTLIGQMNDKEQDQSQNEKLKEILSFKHNNLYVLSDEDIEKGQIFEKCKKELKAETAYFLCKLRKEAIVVSICGGLFLYPEIEDVYIKLYPFNLKIPG